MTRPLLAFAFVLGSFLACSSSASPDGAPASSSGADGGSTAPSNCGSPGRSGKSDCYGRTDVCSAGQYCANGNGNGCRVGCTSDETCSATEHCVRCGTDSVGTCRSCSDTKDGCTATPEPDAGPTDPCERNTAIDFMCTKPTAAKAYECFGQEPVQTGCEHGMGSPTVFCCPK